MNSETRALLIKIILLLATSAATYFHSTNQLTPAIAADVADLLAFAWSLYSNRAMKLVPSNSVAIAPENIQTVSNPVGSTAIVTSSSGKTVGAKVVGALLLALLIGGNIQPGHAATADPLAALKAFTVSDIQGALDDAKAQNDTQGVQCWSALLPAVQSQQAIKLQKLGVFTALQKARDLDRLVSSIQSPTGMLSTLKDACASVIVDTNTFLLKLGVVGGGALLK